MRSGRTQYTQAHKALNDIGILTDHGSTSPDLAIISLDYLYRPASYLSWKRGEGWRLNFDGRAYADHIQIGPPDMTPGKAARAVARLLTEQAKRQAAALTEAVYEALGDDLMERLGYDAVWQLRRQITATQTADVLAEQDGDDR